MFTRYVPGQILCRKINSKLDYVTVILNMGDHLLVETDSDAPLRVREYDAKTGHGLDGAPGRLVILGVNDDD